jgi:galactokinase
MTGAGFGGCTVQLVRSEHAEDFAAALAQRFRARFGRTPRHWRTAVAPAAALVPLR